MDFSDGLLSDDLVTQFEDHRVKCPHCAGYASKYLETIRLGRDACHYIAQEASPQVPEQLVRRILEAQRGGEFLA
jgi:anti-sigma factor RsiW